MLYTKLLLRRLACMPWLLVVGLVLGWSEEVVAQDVNISLAVNPTAISEDAGRTGFVVTATLDGKVFDEDVVVFLVFDENVDNAARRDVELYGRTASSDDSGRLGIGEDDAYHHPP